MASLFFSYFMMMATRHRYSKWRRASAFGRGGEGWSGCDVMMGMACDRIRLGLV